MTTSKRNATIPDAPKRANLNDAAKADDMVIAMPAAVTSPRLARRRKEKPATMKGTTPAPSENFAPIGASPATGAAVANALPGSKLDRLLTILRQPDGTTISDLLGATGWQAHSVRGAIAGTLRKKGHAVVSEKKGDGERRYRLQEAP